jgi:hypothetical protein
MNGDITNASSPMATNDVVDDLKKLSSCQTKKAYSVTIERLTIRLKNAAPNGLMDNKPLAMAIVDNLHRVIPIFDKKLLEKNENSVKTNLFLQTLAIAQDGLCLLDLFLAIKDSTCVKIIFHNYIPLLKQNYFTDDNKYDHLVNCLLPIISFSSMLVSVSENDLPPNLLSYLLEFTKKNWHCETRQKIINTILGLMKVFSKTPSLVPMVIRCQWPNACIQWLTTTGPRPAYLTDFFICLILQKLARHTVGVDALNQLQCIKALDESKEQMKKDHNEEEYTTINFIQCITYALLVEADEIKRNSILADGLLCQVLKQLTVYVFQAAKNRWFVHKGCHISEMLCVFSKLFVNDDILTKCLKESSQLFDCLCQLLIQFATINDDTARLEKILNDEALITLTNLLWSISFHESYHEKFKSNRKLMQTLSNLATSSFLYTNTQIKLIPRDLASLKKAAESILWNLKASHSTQSKEKSEQQTLIMISYSHSDLTFCRELVDNLSPHIPVWVDYKQGHDSPNHSDDLWEEIAGAMELASVIVLIVSKAYYDSKSCRQELSYATDTLKKRVVPVYVPDQQYKAGGWLGIRIAGQKYVHFGRKSFKDALKELLSIVVADQKSKIIVAQKSITTSSSSHEIISTKTNEWENPLKNWTSKDIRKWFDDNHIHNDLITLFVDQFHTGTALLVYAHHLKQFYRNEYVQILATYHKVFNGKRLHTVDFVTFVDAFWRLREKYDPQSKIEDDLEKSGRNQYPFAMKLLSEGMTWL